MTNRLLRRVASSLRSSHIGMRVAEGFVPARLPKRMTIKDGHPEVPLTRYRKGQRENGSS
jgi:hypothetical protein